MGDRRKGRLLAGIVARALAAVVAGTQAFVDLFAFGADRELLGIAAGGPHLAAQCDDRSPVTADSMIFSLRT